MGQLVDTLSIAHKATVFEGHQTRIDDGIEYLQSVRNLFARHRQLGAFKGGKFFQDALDRIRRDGGKPALHVFLYGGGLLLQKLRHHIAQRARSSHQFLG